MKAKICYLAIALFMALALVVAMPATAAEPEDIDAAIDSGVEWLVAQQNDDGSWGMFYPPLPGEWQYCPVAKTALAVLKLEEHAVDSQYGYGLASPLDPTYVYHDNVVAGLDYLLANAHEVGIGPQIAGDPDTNGNGIGVYFVSPQWGTTIYETSIAVMAISASRAPELYQDVVQDAVDWLGWAQSDSGPGEGGWTYEALNNDGGSPDNSNSGWVTLGLAYAESPAYGFECTIPEFVRNELNKWIGAIQVPVTGSPDDGGSRYRAVGQWPEPWVNILKTGTLLQQMAFYGDTVDAQRVQDAIDYIVRHWNDPNDDPGWRGWPGMPASYQATFMVMKGLESFGIDEIDGIDWFDEISDVLVAQQDGGGYWPWCVWDDGEQILSTEWALLTLQKVVPPITATIRIEPETLNLNSKGVFTAFITLPEGLSVADIDLDTVECEGAPAVRGVVADGTLVVKFNRQDLVDVPTGDEVTLTVEGKLVTGTAFAGSDTIRVIKKGRK